MPYKSRFERHRESGLAWHNKSCDLRAAAATLWEGLSNKEISNKIISDYKFGEGFAIDVIWYPFQMICGMSLEVLFKAILKLKGVSFKYHHDLGELAQSADLSYDEQNLVILDMFRETIDWAGRYPVSKKTDPWNKLIKLQKKYFFKKTEGSSIKISNPNAKLDWNSFNDIWTIANSEFWKYYETEKH